MKIRRLSRRMLILSDVHESFFTNDVKSAAALIKMANDRCTTLCYDSGIAVFDGTQLENVLNNNSFQAFTLKDSSGTTIYSVQFEKIQIL